MIYILICKRNAKKIIQLFLFIFLSITSKFILSDINFDSPVNSQSHNMKIMTLRLTHVALKRKILVTPLFHSQRVMIPLIILQKVSKLTAGFESEWGDKIKSEKICLLQRLFLVRDVVLIFDVKYRILSSETTYPKSFSAIR